MTLHRQRGWVGLVVLLLALVIVAMLAQTALKRYGLLGHNAARSAEAARVPGAAAPREVDPTAAPPAPLDALERARGVQGAVRQQAEDLGKRIDDAAK